MDLTTKLTILDRLVDIYDDFVSRFDLACEKFCAHCCTANVTMTTLEGFRILRHLEETCKDAIGTINDLINLHQSFREKAQSAGRSVRLIEIVDMLFETPVTTIPRVQDRLSVTYAAARQLVAKLVEAGILREVDSHPKYFVADDIFRICRPASHE
jgi:hypothetical protein